METAHKFQKQGRATEHLLGAGGLLGMYALAIVLLLSCPLRAQTDGGRQAEIEERFAAAQAAQQRKDYATAERDYRTVLALQPDFAEVHMNLGLIYQMESRIPEAVSEFRRALKIKSGLAGANFFLGVDLCKLGKSTEALSYLTTAARAQPARLEIWSWLATAQEMSGHYQAEIATLRQSLQLRPQDENLLYLLGHAYEQLGKEQVVALHKMAPKSPRSEQLLGESYATSSQWPLAVLHFENALAIAPGLPGLHAELGEVFLQAGKVEAANQQFETELRLHPGELRARVRKGEVELIGGDEQAGLQDWDRALALNRAQVERVLGVRGTSFGDASPNQLPKDLLEKLEHLSPDLRSRNTPAARLALRFLGEQNGAASELNTGDSGAEAPRPCSLAEIQRELKKGLYPGLNACSMRALRQSSTKLRMRVAGAGVEAGDYGPALRLLLTLSAAERRSPEALYLLARCYEQLATAAYLRLYRAAPDSYRAHQLMGELNESRGDDAKAISEYRAAITLNPGLPNLHYSLGHLLWKDLKVPEARAELEAELALNPRHPGALHDLGDTYLLEHHPEQGLPYLLRALAVDADNPDIHRDLGTAYSQLRQYEKAEAEYKLAIAGDHDGSVHYKLGRVYQALGKKQEASREFAVSEQMNRESHQKLEEQTRRLAEIERLPQ